MTNNRFKKLPKYKVFTIWYNKMGIIENLKNIEQEQKYYFLEDVLAHGNQGGKYWVDYLLQKREEITL